MAWRHRTAGSGGGLLMITFWLVPVMIVAINEVRTEMAYNSDDLQKSLTTLGSHRCPACGGRIVALLWL